MSQQQEEGNYKPAPPDYGEEPPYMEDEGRRGLPPARGESIVSKIIPIAAAVLISVLLVGMFFAPVNKKQYEADITRLEADLVAMRAVEKTLTDKTIALEEANKANLAVINDALTKATKDIETKVVAVTNQLTSYATKSELESAKNSITELKTSFASLPAETQAKLTTVSAEIAALKTQITALEKQIEDMEKVTPPSSKAVSISTKTLGSSLMPSNDTTLTTSFRVTLVNNTATEIKDIVLSILVQTDSIVGYTSSTLSGGGTIWQGQGLPWTTREFVNTQWGLNLAANETKTIHLTLTVTGVAGSTYTTTYINGVPYYVEAMIW